MKISKGEIKKNQIINTAIAIIGTRGVEELTFEAIAKHMGTRKSHIAYYYPDKKDIVSSCIQSIVAQGLQIINLHMSGTKNNLKSYVLGNIKWLESYPMHAPVFMLFLYMSTYNDQYKQLFQSIRKNGQERINTILIQEKNKVPVDLIPALSATIQNLITAALIEIHTTKTSKKTIEQSLLKSIKQQIKGASI